MCNLYANIATAEAMRRLYQVDHDNDHLGNAEPLDAIFPKYSAPVVRLDEDNNRELVNLSWGFRTTNKSKKTENFIQPYAWNNARADKVLTASLWKRSFQERRCLVPASSFCEAKGRQPAIYHWFALKGEEPRPQFAFAGMWQTSRFETKDGPDKIEAHTIITTTANDIVRPVHPDRMPVILRPELFEQWLLGSEKDALDLLQPFSSELMRVARIGEGLRSDPIEEAG